ncbi:GNAT family N-acetyltransferase [Bacillus sp. HMF5848]|uniref:GNAT family N-acetyltransferase n=1 Tax=Bacillus sp. HMF5848 TaxID=2495421 RepID=UPI000F78EBB2|nr:GNAT family N-acetyltransferase [Bacillus sp. HMF5848]RSK28571.1 GNAT family N-acetyltransferase [Bacillus sp. HMF5848]
MRTHTYEKVEEFLPDVEEFLLKHEASNNLPLGILYRIRDKGGQPYMAAVYGDDDYVKLVMLQTPPHFLIICGDGEVTSSLVTTVHEAILKQQAPGVIGERKLVEQVVQAWPRESSIVMKQRIYTCSKVHDIQYSEGSLQEATNADIETVAQYLVEFSQETPEATLTHAQATERAQQFVENKSAYLWKVKGSPVTLVCSARKTKSGIVVNAVYTPLEHRKKGYATSAVATLTNQLLQKNRFCALYTDLANPTSNHIYQTVGYKPVSDSLMVRLEREE